MKTYSAKTGEVTNDWYIVDASGRHLGRLASALAHRLRGKHKPSFTPNVDTGDHIIVINAEKVKVTGNKERDKTYYRHTGYPGGIKQTKLSDMRERHPERIITMAVKNMLPNTPLGRVMRRKLRVYKGTEHPHTAQQPQVLDL